jgi:hypothetical protein
MNYRSPRVNQIQVNHFLRNQDSGVIPLNPNCDSVICDDNFTGTFCFENDQIINFDVHYLIPNLDCATLGENPCTVKVDGNVLNCTLESECVETSCNGQAGAILQCSGTLPNTNGCSGTATVECASETDSDGCEIFNP